MTDQLISFETAKLAKEKGFTYLGDNQWPSLGFKHYTIKENGYPEGKLNTANVGIPAPTQSLLQKWLREKHKKSVHVFLGGNFEYGFYIHDLSARDIFEESRNRIYHKANYTIYEESLEQGLIEALKLI